MFSQFYLATSLVQKAKLTWRSEYLQKYKKGKNPAKSQEGYCRMVGLNLEGNN
jgi:hypothetical protein